MHPPREKYYLTTVTLEEIGLSCGNSFALDISRNAVAIKYPHYVKKLEENPFSVFDSWRDYELKNKTYSLKSIFNYYRVGKPSGNWETIFFEESIEVQLTKECEVIDVIYLSGIVTIQT